MGWSLESSPRAKARGISGIGCCSGTLFYAVNIKLLVDNSILSFILH